MAWEVEYTDEFGAWYEGLLEESQEEVVARVELLEQAGPALGRPIVDQVHRSRHQNLKELRVPGGIRVLFAFDPRRVRDLAPGWRQEPGRSRESQLEPLVRPQRADC